MLPILFHLGPLTLHTYGLMVALGFLSGLFFSRKTFEREGIPIYLLDRFALVAMVAGLLGARFTYFAVDGFRGLAGDPWSFFRIWEGGVVYYGGFIGAGIALYFAARSKEIAALTLTDAFAPPLLLAHAIGRLGCLAAGCCYGRPTDGPFKIIFHNPESLAPQGVALHPTQIYESLGNLALFFVLWNASKRDHRRGSIFAMYMIGYGMFRFAVEFLRGDDRGFVFAGLSPSQIMSLVAVAAGAGLWTYVQKRG